MKKTLFLLIIICSCFTIHAQTALVQSNSSELIFKGNNALVEAVSSAATSSTIFLSGGTFKADISINKQLTIYGAGHHPDSAFLTGKTILSGSITLEDNADGFHLEGVELSGGIKSSAEVDDVSIKYCRILGGISFTSNISKNILLTNNAIYLIDMRYMQNAQIYNNVIYGAGTGPGSRLIHASQAIIANNILHFWNGSENNINGDYNTIKNNIFIYAQGSGGSGGVGGNYNEIYNNIYTQSNPGFGINPTHSGNITGVNINEVIVKTVGHQFSYTNDYHLINPENYIGTDGAQIGLYGGFYPWKEGSVPSIPYFTKAYIGNHSSPEGIIKVDIEAQAQDH